MLLEFKEATRHVPGSIATAYHDKNAPAELVAAFPGVGREQYTNGIIQFSKYQNMQTGFAKIANHAFSIVSSSNEQAAHGSTEDHCAASWLPNQLPPVRELPPALHEVAAPQENEGTCRGIRTRNHLSKKGPYWHQKLEGAAHRHWRVRPRARRRKEDRGSFRA